MNLYRDQLPLEIALEFPEEKKDSYPLFIVMHGFCGNKEEALIDGMARMMREEGFATLRPDMYGHGKSGGAFRELTVLKWINDALYLIDYVRSQKQFSRIYLGGHSLGGLTAVMAAAMEKDRIAGVLGLAPALSTPERARKGILMGGSFNPDRVPEEFVIWERVLSGNYVRVAQTIYPEQYLKAYAGPLLFVHGDQDEIVPLESSRNMLQHCKEGALALVPGANHDFEEHLAQAVEAARPWVQRQVSLGI